MAKDALYTLSELAQAAETSPRTIRYYTSEGLLPPPQARGRFALYGLAHVNRLRLIGALKQALLPLGTMREHLPQLSDAQVATLLAQSGLISSALERAANEEAFPLPREAVGTPVEKQSEAYHALSGALSARKDTFPDVPSEDVKNKQERSASTKSRRALLVSSRADAALDGQAASNFDPLLASAVGNDTWQRILLAPGVELHVRTPDSPHAQAHLDRVIAEAKSLFQP